MLALDIIFLNVLDDEAVGDLWMLFVGFGLFVVGTVAFASLVWLPVAVWRSRRTRSLVVSGGPRHVHLDTDVLTSLSLDGQATDICAELS